MGLKPRQCQILLKIYFSLEADAGSVNASCLPVL